jgi:hypothetical protein
MNYNEKLQRLYERRSDPALSMENIRIEDSVYKSYLNESQKLFSNGSSEMEKSRNYAITAMEELPPRSTEISFEEGNKIKGHLQAELPNVEFKFQGSVTTKTHIKGASDIDLLVIINKFYSLEPPQVAQSPYKGNTSDDMTELRNSCIKILENAYSVANVDTTGSKSIKVSGGSLRRDIDVVPANWYDSIKYAKFGYDYLRGVQVFNKDTKERTPNYPFLNQHLIEKKDSECNGQYRPLVRLAKTIKADSENKNIQDLSSYDIQALFYSMPTLEYQFVQGLKLITIATSYLKHLVDTPQEFLKLTVPDETRKISEKVTFDSLNAFYNEFSLLSNSIHML